MKEAGLITYFDPGSDKPLAEVKTACCKHCGGHFPFGPGHTKNRGWCFRCNGPVCGPGCAECVPMEAMLEIAEGTRNPTAVAVAGKLWLP
jgi:hypothetical protein